MQQAAATLQKISPVRKQIPSANPVGENPNLCECGRCGLPAPIATQTDRKHGHIKGRPLRFNRGHNGRRHGMSGTPEHEAYMSAKSRCTDPNMVCWLHYGGRGIRFLFKSFEEFFQELGLRPTPQHSVDRFPNSDGNYEKGNVRWATKTEQNLNRRKREGTSSIYRGVSWNKRLQKYSSIVVVFGKRKFLGYFPKEKEAAEAYDTAAIRYFGVFAKTNFKQKQGIFITSSTTVIRVSKCLLDEIRELMAKDPALDFSDIFVMGLEMWSREYRLVNSGRNT